MILVLDNRDSFTFNLAQVLAQLVPDGVAIRVWRSDAVTPREIAAAHPAAILVGPGPGTPDRAGCSEAVVRELSEDIPVFGVCLGHQAIATALGGELLQSQELVHGSARPIEHDGRGVFRGLASPIPMARYNSLTVEPEGLPSELEVSARGPQGEIMGLRHRARRLEGVQFHPESILCVDTGGRELLGNFVEGALAD